MGLLPSPEWVSAISAAVSAFTAVAIVILTAGYVRVSKGMLKKIGEQVRLADVAAQAAKDAADAAKTNTDALMSGERAWLLIEGIHADADFTEQGIPRFTYSVANFGKTPGFMVARKGYILIADNPDVPKDESFADFYGGIGDNSVVTPNGESLCLGSDSSFFEVDETQRAKVCWNPPELYLWACGCIHYNDVFGHLRKTPFAYWYNVGEGKFVRSSFPSLNKPT